MANPIFSSSNAFILVALIAALIYTAEIPRASVVLGFWRHNTTTVFANQDYKILPDTVHCEDVHYHEASDLLFTACEGTEDVRHSWFPPLGIFDDPTKALKAQGRLQVINPRTFTVKKLDFTNFNGPFITHGIDVIDDPERPKEAVYIFAVNHVPSPAYAEDKHTKSPKARSIIEVFHHVIGSSTVQHIRSVWDPLITTPNDIFAVSPTSFFVTNDHFYREGVLRDIETVLFSAKWTNTIYVEFTDLTDGAFRDDDHEVRASVAIGGVHNNNGLGHGRTPDEILIASCASGRVHVGEISPAVEGKRTIKIKETVEFDSIVDNPGWFRDPYAKKGDDQSGILGPGLFRGIDLQKTMHDPQGRDGVTVFLAKPDTSQGKEKWQKKLLFDDDASKIRTASGSVLVAIDPAKEQGERKAWLFVTGFLSKSMIAVKVDL